MVATDVIPSRQARDLGTLVRRGARPFRNTHWLPPLACSSVPQGTTTSEPGGRRGCNGKAPSSLNRRLGPSRQSTSRNGMIRHKNSAGSLHPSGSSVAARSGALKVMRTSSVGMLRRISNK